MSRIERCYRRLIRLLPAEERAARGEEFLGLLLEMEEGRSWPSAPEVAALLSLAVRLHLRRPAVARLGLGLLGAYLTVIGTNTASHMLAIGLDPGAESAFASLDVSLVAIVAVGLAVVAAWMLGAYRTSLILFSALTGFRIHTLAAYLPGTGFGIFLFMLGGIPGLIWDVLTCIGVPAALIMVVRHRPARPPRPVGLAGLAVAFAAQTIVYIGSGPGGVSALTESCDRFAPWLLSVACAATIALHTRRQARPVLAAAMIAGLGGGWTLSVVMPQLVAGAVAVTLCAGESARVLSTRVGARTRQTATGSA